MSSFGANPFSIIGENYPHADHWEPGKHALAKCSCGQFQVASCCGRYLEDAQGRLIHTTRICYETGEDGKVTKARLPEGLLMALSR